MSEQSNGAHKRADGAAMDPAMNPDLPQGLREDHVDIGIGRVHYVTAGDGPLLVALHGGYGSWEHWIANILPLAQGYTGHTVVAPDMPGFGLSCDINTGDTGMSIERYAEQVWEAISAIRNTLAPERRMQPIRLVAFSFGTAVAAMLASRHPYEIRSALLVNPPGLGEVTQEVKEVQARAGTTARNHGLRAGVEVTLREFMLCQPSRMDAFAGDILERCVRRCRFLSRSLSRATPMTSILPGVSVPVHVVLGAQDPHQRSQLEERVARVQDMLGPDACTVFSDTAHWLQYEQPERFNRLALDWFAALDEQDRTAAVFGNRECTHG